MAQPMNPQVAEDNPYINMNATVEDNQKALRRLDAGAKAVSYNEPLDNIEDDSFYKSIEEQDSAEVAMMEDERLATNKQTISSLAESGREDLIPSSMSMLKEDYEASAERARNAITPFMARVYNTPGAEHLSDSEILDIAIDDYSLDSFATALDNQGGWEFAGDILGMMVVPDESYNASQITEDGSWFTSYEGMLSLAEKREALSPDERLKFDANLKETLKDVDDNLVQQYTLALSVMGRNDGLALDHYGEKIGLAVEFVPVAGQLIKGMRKLGPLRRLSKIGNHRAAAIAAEVALSPEGSKGTGVSKLDSVMSGNPLKEALKDDTLSGTTVTPSSATRDRIQDVDLALSKYDDTFGVRTLPTEEETANMAAAWRKEMEGNDNFEAVHVEQTVDGVAIDYKTPEGFEDKYVEYTLDDLGGFQEKELPLWKTLTRYVWSPSFLQGKDAKDLVGAATIGQFQKAKKVAVYDRAFKVALKPVKGNRESLEKVNYLLGKLNGQDVEVSRHSLVNTGIGGTRLTDKEADTVLGIRQIFDHMHEQNNYTMKRELQRQGLSAVDIDGEVNFVRSFDKSTDAYQAYRLDTDNNQVLTFHTDGSLSNTSDLTKEALDAAYAEGKQFVRVDGGDQYGWFSDATNNRSRYALVDSDSIGGIPDQVLGKVPNYVPRMRDEANFFIKRKVDMKVNGNNRTAQKTVAFARTDAEANRWLAQAAKADDKFNADEWVIAADRAGGDASDMTTIRMNGGMYRGSRSSTPILDAATNTEGETIDALDTLQGAMRYTADRSAMSEVRQTTKRRWYTDAAEVDPEIAKLGWSEARGAVAESNAPLQVKSKLLSSHDQISNIIGIPSKSEQNFAGALRAIGNHYDKKGQENAARWFYNRATKSSPINTLKGSAFHMMLGAFNPAQYIVQFMGATVAVGANPVSFTRAVPRIMAASMTDLADNASMHSKALDLLAKRKLITKDMEQDIIFWRDSGMYESVLRNNADFDNSGSYMPADAGMVRRGVNSLGSKSTVFYEMGELGSMRTSFFTALEHEKSLLGGDWSYSEQNLQKVVSRAEDYRLGMSAANKAEFQKGLLALPTQFKSIYTKYLEMLMGKKLTGAEKSRVVASQMAIFGAAGVPLINHWQDNVAEMLAPENASAEELQAYKKGALGWLISDYWDVDAEVVSRTAVAGDIVQEFKDMMFSEEPFIKSFMGASFTSTDKATSAVKNTLMAGKLLWEDEDATSAAKVSMAAKVVAYQLTQIPTASRRWMEAYVLGAFGEVRTSTGRTLYQVNEINTRDVVARSLGFSSEDLQEIYETNQALYDRKDKVKNISDTYIGLINSLTLATDEQDEEQALAIQMALSAIKRRVDNDKDRSDIWNSVKTALGDRDFKGRTFDKWLEAYGSELLNAKGRVFLTGQREFEEVVE